MAYPEDIWPRTPLSRRHIPTRVDRHSAPPKCSKHCVRFIEEEIFQNVCPPDDVACILVEPIESVAGEIVPPDDFLPQLRELYDTHGIMLGADEVKTGFGRTGKLFAVDHTKTIPDFVLLGNLPHR